MSVRPMKHVKINEAVTLLYQKISLVESMAEDISDKDLRITYEEAPYDWQTESQSVSDFLERTATVIRDAAARLEIATGKIREKIF